MLNFEETPTERTNARSGQGNAKFRILPRMEDCMSRMVSAAELGQNSKRIMEKSERSMVAGIFDFLKQSNFFFMKYCHVF